MSSIPDIIRERAATVVKAASDDEIGIYRSIKRLVATTIKEYSGRFVHELIQNGYDAHPDGMRDGKIAVHFHDTEGDFGVLYVANGGRPLSHSNFTRMASLGDSDKAIGVGIGNKGVGFKSVFQICHAPEVYSALDLDDPGFSGYSFRFGVSTDLDDYLDPGDPLRDKLEAGLSLSMLTVPLDAIPPTVADLRGKGFVTVLRLPASSPRAAAEILGRIDALVTSRSPIMLFLDRLESLSIKSSTAAPAIVLTRRKQNDGDLDRVVLNETDSYLLFEGEVVHNELVAALSDEVEKGALDEEWLKWRAEARVSIAIGDGWTIPNPAPFTFLPMGDSAVSPLACHINAPFMTDFARRGVDLETSVNRLMFRRIAEVCVVAAEHFMAARWHAGAVADLMAWKADSLEWITDAVERLRSTTPDEFIRLPAIGRSDWHSLRDLSLWPGPASTVITVDRLAKETPALFIDTAQIDEQRLDRLAITANKCGCPLTPEAAAMARWVETVAAGMQSGGADIDDWRAFYDDLPLLFRVGEALQGRRIILTQSGELVSADYGTTTGPGSRAAGTPRRAVFFSPRIAGTDDDDAVDADIDTSPPRSLARRIVFLHSELTWYVGPQQTPGRKFLQEQRLARQFRTASLLNHLGQLMAAEPSDAVKRDALDFAFRLFANNPSKHSKELTDVGLAVPTVAGGWIAASRAHFSKGWDVDGAMELSDLVAGAPDAASELAQMATRLIAGPPSLGGEAPNVDKWVAFLKVLGVTATLPINHLADNRRILGQSLSRDGIAGRSAPSGLPEGVRSQWAAGITSTGNGDYPKTEFATKDHLCWFAGQHEVSAISDRLRRAYARLVVLTAPSLRPDHKSTTWRRARDGGVPTEVETPLWSFLTRSSWVPIAIPSEPERHFCPASEGWYVGGEDTMAATYSSLIEPPLRRLLDSVDANGKCRRELGFLGWNDPKDASELVDHLTDIFARGDIPETAGEHFRSSLAAAWTAVGDAAMPTVPNLDHMLLVQKSGQLRLQSREPSAPERIYVTGNQDRSTTARLVHEFGWPVVAVETADPVRLKEVASVLRDRWHEDVVVTSNWDLEVLVEGAPWTPSDAAPRLIDEVPWLPLLVAASMLYPRASGMRVGRKLERWLDELTRIRIVRCDRVAVASAFGDQALPARLQGVLPIAGPTPTLLAEGHQSPPTWGQLEVLTQAVLELLDQERFKAEISLTIRDLSTGVDQPVSRPTNAEFAEVLQVSEQQIGEVESAVYGAVAGVVARLRLVLPALWQQGALESFEESLAASYSRDDVLAVLTRLSEDPQQASSILEMATDSPDSDALRRRLGVPLDVFNQCLSANFPTVPPIDYGPSQRQDFDLRLRQRRRELIDWARANRIEQFDAGRPQPDWLEIRDLSFLEADPAWATTLDDVNLDLLDQRIDAGMSARLGARQDPAVELPDLEEVRAASSRPLRQRLADVQRLVTAWCDREGVARPELWGSENVEDAARQTLERAGALDFRELSDVSLAEWLSRVDAWPAGMPLDVAPAAHGLTSDVLNTHMVAEAQAKAERARLARQVQFRGAAIDLEPSMSGLVDQVSKFLDSNPTSLDSAYRTSPLAEISATRTGGSSAAAPKSAGVVINRLSTEQSGAIGLVGEMIALHWLKNRDRSGVVDESCWKSGNARFAVEGAVGDDSLGYDFEVPRRGGNVMYEVKATTGEPGMIELGETEVRCAQLYARTNRWRLLIVGDALSSDPHIHMLPNPFHHDSRSRFRFVGNSVRLRFTLS